MHTFHFPCVHPEDVLKCRRDLGVSISHFSVRFVSYLSSRFQLIISLLFALLSALLATSSFHLPFSFFIFLWCLYLFCFVLLSTLTFFLSLKIISHHWLISSVFFVHFWTYSSLIYSVHRSHSCKYVLLKKPCMSRMADKSNSSVYVDTYETLFILYWCVFLSHSHDPCLIFIINSTKYAHQQYWESHL